MPKYTNTAGKINLNHYTKVKELTTGKTNQVSLWEHKQDRNLKIVVKVPNGPNSYLIQNNVRSINAFFGDDSAWLIEGKNQGKEGFAMKYYPGMPLSPQEESQLIDKDESPLRTISKNGLLFTMLDPNKDNFLKLSSGEFIPIDFDYMIIHGTKLLPYQELYLEGRMGFAIRVGGRSEAEATEYVLDSYPAAASYLYEQWGHKYLKTDKYTQTSEVPKLVIDIPTTQKQRPISTAEKNFNDNIDLLHKKITAFSGKPECQDALKAANIVYDALMTEGKNYFSGAPSKERYTQFKNNCESYIKTARLELDNHRGCRKILLNILAIVLSGGIGYAFAAGVNIALNRGKFTFFSTDSSIKLNSIVDGINKMAPAA
ncbi:hypothetical protein [Legionella hackeliae]|uniref:Effector protein B, substrate of the Dot/Icm secretion system n=1 Tax=Legionella hackeliae TaxID=449 RepID=A0A0A8USA8_LEGHA|nr:hypothetical protein [Legionella hackeliae]KTD10129.1 hypothetical protein Lhac_2497 [Legionella hackeliae]CEK09619.1 conserved protein of unknown function [Legionella hackeliae]STX49534.1 Uncharacterised protein [Legionella hackeliae]